MATSIIITNCSSMAALPPSCVLWNETISNFSTGSLGFYQMIDNMTCQDNFTGTCNASYIVDAINASLNGGGGGGGCGSCGGGCGSCGGGSGSCGGGCGSCGGGR